MGGSPAGPGDPSAPCWMLGAGKAKGEEEEEKEEGGPRVLARAAQVPFCLKPPGPARDPLAEGTVAPGLS